MKIDQNEKFSRSSTRHLTLRALFAWAFLLFLSLPSSGSGPVTAQSPVGTIAYVRPNDATGDEIRLVEPDGSGSRLLWKTSRPGAVGLEDISSLAWDPAARQLAFASRHEESCSFYASDIYAVAYDGTGYRRITAPPDCGQAAVLPKGTVRVTIENWSTSSGPFLVYFEGAPGPKSVSLAPNGTTMVTFTNVGDYGTRKQWAVVVYGDNRYTAVSGNADVIAGSTVDTGGSIIIGYATRNWAWAWPTWKSDGSQISYVFGVGTPYTIPAANITPGEIGAKLFNVADDQIPLDPDFLTWSPAGPRANQLLYTGWGSNPSGETIYLATGGGTTPGSALVYVDEGVGRVVLGLAWLPDSSGFLYSKTEGYGQNANIYEYKFATNQSTKITNYTSGYPRRLSISPDGTKVVYEYQSTGEWTENDPQLDLWMMNRNGSGKALTSRTDASQPGARRTFPWQPCWIRRFTFPRFAVRETASYVSGREQEWSICTGQTCAIPADEGEHALAVRGDWAKLPAPIRSAEARGRQCPPSSLRHRESEKCRPALQRRRDHLERSPAMLPATARSGPG